MFNDYILQFDIILHGSLRNKKIPGNKFLVQNLSQNMLAHTVMDLLVALAESFYYIKYRSSIFMSKILSEILSNENKNNWCFQKYSLFWHFDSRFVLKTTKTPVFMFLLLRFFD